MDVKSALHFIIFQYLWDQAQQYGVMPMRSAECKPGGGDLPSCPSGFLLTKKNNYPICYAYGDSTVIFREAFGAYRSQVFCQRRHAHLPRLDTDDEIQQLGGDMLLSLEEKMRFAGFLAIWLAADNANKTYQITDEDGIKICPAFTSDGRRIYLVCSIFLLPMCEVEAKGEKPVVSVTSYGQSERQQQELVLYENTRVKVSCSVIRSMESVIHIHVKSDSNYTWLFSANSLTTSTYFTECGIKTVAYIERDLRVHTVTCVLGRLRGPTCSRKNRDCAQMGPFTYSYQDIKTAGQMKPKISVKFFLPPDFVSDRQPILARCSYFMRSGSAAIRWAVTVDDELYVLEQGKPGVRITETVRSHKTGSMTTTSLLRLDIRDRCWSGKELLLICYTSHNPPVMCLWDNVFCNTVIIRVQQKLSVHVHAKTFNDERLLFENSTVTVTCTSIPTSAKKLAILLWDKTTSTSRLFDQEDMHVANETLKCGLRTRARLELYLDSSAEVMKEFLVTCTVGIAAVYPCPPLYPYCNKDGPLRYLKAPNKVDIKVEFSKPPNIVTDGTNIVARCSSYSFAPAWAIADPSNKQEFKDVKQSSSSVNIRTTMNGKVWKSELILETKGKRWATHSLKLMCFNTDSYDRQTRCLENYFWCRIVLIYIASGPDGTDDSPGKPGQPPETKTKDEMYFILFAIGFVSVLLLSLLLCFICYRECCKNQ